MSHKPVVNYSEIHFLAVGLTAIVDTVDHPRHLESKHVATTEVLRFEDETGEFETVNTIYRPNSMN